MTSAHAGTLAGQQAEERVGGIDAVRFLCAAWVALDHFGGLPFLQMAAVGKQHAIGLALWGINNNLFPGPAAVIVFFVVSGFCVHRPYAMGRPLAVGPHLARRFVRVCPPLFAAMLLSQLVAGRLLIGNVLWSLICELIYYAIYPALFILIKRCGWYAVLGAAFAGAVAMRLELGRDFGNYVDYGYALTWLIGLPCWLTGCYIAEKVDIARPSPSKRGLWGIRIGVWALGMVLSMLRFHTPIDFKWTLDFFAIPGGIWFVAEMRAARNSGLPAWMERAGAWSYSLYLFHEVGMYLVDATFPDSAGASWSIFLKWLLTVVAGFGLSWIMYRVIERPAHDWARWLSKRVPDGLRLSSGRALVPVPLNPT